MRADHWRTRQDQDSGKQCPFTVRHARKSRCSDVNRCVARALSDVQHATDRPDRRHHNDRGRTTTARRPRASPGGPHAFAPIALVPDWHMGRPRRDRLSERWQLDGPELVAVVRLRHDSAHDDVVVLERRPAASDGNHQDAAEHPAV